MRSQGKENSVFLTLPHEWEECIWMTPNGKLELRGETCRKRGRDIGKKKRSQRRKAGGVALWCCFHLSIVAFEVHWQSEYSQQEQTGIHSFSLTCCFINPERLQQILFKGTTVSLYLQTKQTTINQRIPSQGGCEKFAFEFGLNSVWILSI